MGLELDKFPPKVAIIITIILGGATIAAATLPSVFNNSKELALTEREATISGTQTAIAPQLTQIAQILNATPEPPPLFLERIAIPSTTNQGVIHRPTETGIYQFEYVTGAFSAWQFVNNQSEEGRWGTLIVGFKGAKPIYDGRAMRLDLSLFTIGEAGYGSENDATIGTVGERVSVELQANEEITLVAFDGRYDFGDNSGEVILDIYFVAVPRS